MDWLARNLDDLRSVTEALAPCKRDLIRERQREGIALAKLREAMYTGRSTP